MTKFLLAAGFVVLVGIMSALLAVLIDIDRHGVTVNIGGKVNLTGSTPGTLGKVNLTMEKPVALVATGPDNAPVPANLSIATCPKCGGSMVPVRWNLLTGEIVWKCLECGYTTTGAPINRNQSGGH